MRNLKVEVTVKTRPTPTCSFEPADVVEWVGSGHDGRYFYMIVELENKRYVVPLTVASEGRCMHLDHAQYRKVTKATLQIER